MDIVKDLIEKTDKETVDLVNKVTIEFLKQHGYDLTHPKKCKKELDKDGLILTENTEFLENGNLVLYYTLNEKGSNNEIATSRRMIFKCKEVEVEL